MSYRDHYEHWNPLDADAIKKRIQNFNYLLKIADIGHSINSALDIGCGDGVSILAMKEYGIKNPKGIDTNIEQINAATQITPNVFFVESTEVFLKNEKEKYDLITLFDVIEHIPQEKQLELLTLIHAALKPHGRILIAAPNANASFASRYRYIDWTHHCSFTEHSIKYILTESNFSNIKVSEAERKLKLIKNLFKPYIFNLILAKMFRSMRRLEAIAEFGPEEGKAMPLSLNLLAVATKHE